MTNKDPIPSLELIKATSSGLNSFNRSKFSQELSYIQELDTERELTNLANRIKLAPFLHLFLMGRHTELRERLDSDPSLIALSEIKALKLINLLILGETLCLRDLFPLASSLAAVPNKSSQNLAAQIIKLYSALYLHLNLDAKFRSLKFKVLEEFLPDINLRFAEFVLRYRIASKYTEVWEILSPYAELDEKTLSANNTPVIASESPVIASAAKQSIAQNLEAIRLLAIYKRMQADILGAEKYSYLYHKYFKPDLEKRSYLITHANSDAYPASELLKNWSSVLEECDSIQTDIFKQAGLETSTCEYFECSDCCEHTFPVMSYTEFSYLHDWLTKNNYPLAELEARCEEIQTQYEAQYGTRLTVLNKNLAQNNIRGIENPHGFKYTCPFLSADGRCGCYAARPLLCRGFGLSTDNGISTKSCQYYIQQYQYNSNSEGDRDVYDLRQVQTLARSSDRYLSKQEGSEEKVLSGTIVAWFSKDDPDGSSLRSQP